MTTSEHDTVASPPTPWLSKHDIAILQAARGILAELDQYNENLYGNPRAARCQGIAHVARDAIFSVLSAVSVYGPAPIPDEALYG